ncbi:hypothetical protein [Geodermatophilus amargosae]|uniref:hypothetical protein n=1 Tax=Geodermatophilus amargosae TaxID=1296565 RepID=UPI001114745A|nr:hypothetical protein [Geodermatophilus amargosae]
MAEPDAAYASAGRGGDALSVSARIIASSTSRGGDAVARSCPFPEKERLMKEAARARAMTLNRCAYDGRTVHAYRCPAGGHHHVGHRRPRGRRRRW